MTKQILVLWFKRPVRIYLHKAIGRRSFEFQRYHLGIICVEGFSGCKVKITRKC